MAQKRGGTLTKSLEIMMNHVIRRLLHLLSDGQATVINRPYYAHLNYHHSPTWHCVIDLINIMMEFVGQSQTLTNLTLQKPWPNPRWIGKSFSYKDKLEGYYKEHQKKETLKFCWQQQIGKLLKTITIQIWVISLWGAQPSTPSTNGWRYEFNSFACHSDSPLKVAKLRWWVNTLIQKRNLECKYKYNNYVSH